MENQENPPLPPVGGSYRPSGARQDDYPHHEGYTNAIANALENAADEWKKHLDPPFSVENVEVRLEARVDVTNPGTIGDYRVMLIPR